MKATFTNLVSTATAVYEQSGPSASLLLTYSDSKVHGANVGPTWILWATDGPHVGPMNLAIWVVISEYTGVGIGNIKHTNPKFCFKSYSYTR